MSHKRSEHQEEGESPIGFIMFGDLMSQLLCFFILLFVFASKYVSKTQGTTYEDFLKKVSENFKKVVDEKNPQKEKNPTSKTQKPIVAEATSEQLKIAESLKNLILDEKLNDYVSVIVEEKKIRIVFKQPILFDLGKADLKESGKLVLSDIGQVLLKTKNPIDVEGHTDNAPIHTPKYDSNWDLSFDRAYSVIKFMVNQVGMTPIRLHAIGYGEYRPIAPNTTSEEKEKNRRIEINVLFNERVQL